MKQAQTFLLTLIFAISGFISHSQVVQTICSFYPTNGVYQNGSYPFAGLTFGTDGNLYGMASSGGSSGIGTIFKVTTNGSLTAIYSFTNAYDTAPPCAGLTLGGDGAFYGTVSFAGHNGLGIVFKITTAGAFTTLHSFGSGDDANNGNRPIAGLALGNDGILYGTTTSGPVNGSDAGSGTIFKVTTNGVLTTLFAFAVANGAHPCGTMTLGNDGNLYGTTTSGGTNGGYGTVFKATTNGILTTLVHFANTNGAAPYGELAWGGDGNLYGTTSLGGVGFGTLFKVTTNGTLTTLYSFRRGNDGENPYDGLTLGTDGIFYGTAASDSGGTIFKVTTNGVFTTLANVYEFGGPYAKLTLAGDGSFYGTTYSGGNSTYGSVFHLLLPPPKLSLQLLGGYPSLKLNGILGSSYVVQYSTNLAGTNWINLLSLTNLSANPYQFLDPAGVVPPARFYRAVMQ